MASGTAIVFVSCIATAQEAAPTVSEIESIEVVGSWLRDVDPEGMSPVLILDRDAIVRSGVVTVAEALQQLPMDNAGTLNDRDALSSALGGAAISFRGMGANAVLVLINGRRATAYGFPQVTGSGGLVSFVDLNSVPLAAVERIEVLKDGASAIYGSDAMAGVVNIVLREDISGTDLELRLGGADGSGAEERAVNALMGWRSSRTSVALIATHTDREQLQWLDRAVSASANRENAGGFDQRSLAAVNFWVNGVGTFGADCEARNTTDGSRAYTELPEYGICVFDPNTEIVVPSAQRTGLTALLSHALSPKLELHLEASYLLADAEGRRDPVPWSDGLFPAGNPWNPFAQDVFAAYRFSETGPRIDTVQTDSGRVVVALEGKLNEWEWEYSALYHSATTQNIGEGYLSAARIEQALNGSDLNGDGILQQDEYLNLFSAATNPSNLALINSLKVATYRQSNTKLSSHLLRFARRLLQMRAGDLSVAIGVEHRNESLDDASDPLSLGTLLAATQVFRGWYGLRVDQPFDQIDPYEWVDPWDVPAGPLEPTGFPSAYGTRSQNAFFGELRIPILTRLVLQAALRYEDILDFGDEISPRVALRFDATPRFRLRASWGKGFRAPSLVELYSGPATKLQGSWDPKRCPEPNFLIPERAGGCAVRSFVTATLGNPDLDAEHSESMSAGFDVQIFDKHNASLDCWNTDVRDKILTPQTAWVIRNEDVLAPGFIERDPLGDDEIVFAEPRDAYPGTIARVNLLPLNFGRQKVKGCDIELSSVWDRIVGGIFEAQLLGTHMASNELAAGGSDVLEELAGTYGYPQNRANMNLLWRKNDWQVGFYGRWTDGFDDTVPDVRVASHTEWDAQLSYSGLRAARLTLGVENLFDEPPPMSLGGLHLQGFPVQFYDMRGRYVYAQASISLGRQRQSAGQPAGPR